MNNITIIGIGLIGSSLARAIRHNYSKVLINFIDVSEDNLKKSKSLSLADSYNTKINSDVEKSEFIFISSFEL